MSTKKNDEGQKQRIAFYGRLGIYQPETANAQIKLLMDAVNEHPEWIIQDLYFDIGPADPELKNMPALQSLLRDAAKGRFDRVVTMKVSRIAREPCGLLEISRRLKKYGIEIDFLAERSSTECDTFQMLMRLMELQNPGGHRFV